MGAASWSRKGSQKRAYFPAPFCQSVAEMSNLLRAKRKLLIGVVHLKPLPGSPRWAGNLEALIDFAVADARAYERGGVDAIITENFGDAPFTKGAVAPETLTAMTAAGRAIRAAVKVPIGFNVLRNDA